MVREIDQTPVWLKPPRAGTSKHPGLEDVAAVLDEINEVP